MSATNLGLLDWSLEVDQEGHRTYETLNLVKTTDYEDGPTTAMLASGLASIGVGWSYGNDSDPFAVCWPTMSVQRWQPRPGERSKHWTVTQIYSTKPMKRCQDSTIEDPLAEPPKISGSYARYMKRVEQDRFGNAILGSNLEPYQGIEKPDARPTVVIEQNLADLELPIYSEMVNGLNDSPLWGVGSRCVMLTNCQWSRQVYGTCGYYFTRRLEFEIKFDGYDITDALDKGYKILRGKWAQVDGETAWVTNPFLDPLDPQSYMLFKDYFGENTPVPVLLKDGALNLDPNDPQYLPTLEIQEEYNFAILNIPLNLAF